jgi:hypothetical protein
VKWSIRVGKGFFANETLNPLIHNGSVLFSAQILSEHIAAYAFAYAVIFLEESV